MIRKLPNAEKSSSKAVMRIRLPQRPLLEMNLTTLFFLDNRLKGKPPGREVESWQSKCPLDSAQALPQRIPECRGTEEDRLGRAEGSTLGSRSLKRPIYPQSPPQFIVRVTSWKWPTFGSFDCCDSSNREVSQDVD